MRPPNITLLNRQVSLFRLFGYLGFIIAILLVCLLMLELQLSWCILIILIASSVLTFFGLVVLTIIVKGKEELVYYHHEIAILITCSCVLRIFHLPVLQYLDIIMLGIATFLAFGRIGCLSVGCCHGRPSGKGVVYGHEHVKAGFTSYYEGVPLFPIQLVESAFVFLLVITGSFILLRQLPQGTFLILYTIGYGAFRFIIEFFRGDAERPYWKGLSEAQWTTLLLIVISLVLAFNGLIPFYNWHIIISLFIFIFSIISVFRNDILVEISNPRHIRQIAMAINKSYNDDLALIKNKKTEKPIKIFQTDLGLSLSHGNFEQGGTRVMHYTVSSRKKNLLTYPLVTKLAVLIQQLEKHSCSFEIYRKKNSVFHIVFKE